MIPRNAHVIALLLSVPLLLAMADDAHAYIDLGTGSFMLQILLAGLLAVAFTVKSWWRNITSSVSRLLSRKPSPENSKLDSD
jgi:hypothetical protein